MYMIWRIFIIICLFIVSIHGQLDDLESFDEEGEEGEDEDEEEIPMTTVDEQCIRFEPHYRYYCQTTNIAEHNDEVRIICDRYRAFCAEHLPATLDYIRRSRVMWQQSGLPAESQKAISRCLSGCRQTDPICVLACECIYYEWIMTETCGPRATTTALPNCQRWYKKCQEVWKPSADRTPYPVGVLSPPPIARGIFYGYDPLSNIQTTSYGSTSGHDHGVSFFRGTNTVLVDWINGQVAGGSTAEVPAIGFDMLLKAYNIGFPSISSAYRSLNRQNPAAILPGTGRRQRRYINYL